MTSGIHHVTAITRDVQRNVDFYMGFLGLHVVKQTGGFEDAGQLHLFYGDSMGSPGSVVTFLVWQDGARGRVELGQVSEIALAIPPGFVTGGPGTGVIDHVAFRAPDTEVVRRMRLDLREREGVINVHDRKYFLSLYVREPAGTLFEHAADGPASPPTRSESIWARP